MILACPSLFHRKPDTKKPIEEPKKIRLTIKPMAAVDSESEACIVGRRDMTVI